MFKRIKDDSVRKSLYKKDTDKKLADQASSKPDIGKDAENFAQRYLKSNKLKILETNYNTKRGELDIIGLDKDTLVFVEVRLRSHRRFGSAADSISYNKQQRIIYAATHYLQSTGQWEKVNCRFDALCLNLQPAKSSNANEYQVEWIRNAFSIS